MTDHHPIIILSLDSEQADALEQAKILDRAILSPHERDRFEMQLASKGSNFNRQVRMGLRLALGHCLSLPACDIRIGESAMGKPFVDPLQGGRIAFNVSHSRFAALIAIGAGQELGVDIEAIDAGPGAEWEALLDSCFDAQDADRIRSLPLDAARAAFHRGWTRKEAVAKAVGTGFLMDPRALPVPIEDAQRCSAVAPGGMRFELLDLGRDGFAAALAAETITSLPRPVPLVQFLALPPPDLRTGGAPAQLRPAARPAASSTPWTQIDTERHVHGSPQICDAAPLRAATRPSIPERKRS